MLLTALVSFYGTSAHSYDVQYRLYGHVVKSYWLEVKPQINVRRQILQQIGVTANKQERGKCFTPIATLDFKFSITYDMACSSNNPLSISTQQRGSLGC